jgi:hypothetical protein
VGAQKESKPIHCPQGNWEQTLGAFEELEGAAEKSAVALARHRANRVGLQCIALRMPGGYLVVWRTGRGGPTCESGHFT